MPTADQMEESRHGAHERAKVLSHLQTHLLPDGGVEYGVACVILGSEYFGDYPNFISISDATQIPQPGEEVDVTYYEEFWTSNFPKRGDNGRFVLGHKETFRR